MQSKVKWLLPIALILFLAPFTPTLDLFFTRASYFDDGFSFNPLPFRLLFEYGEILGFALGILACMIVLLSFKKKELLSWRAPSLAFLLTLVLGAGLITNLGFKQYWGRPRPKQVIEFGGKHEYRPYYKPNFLPEEKQRSFPSGHVAMGCSFFSFLFSFRRMGKKRLFYIALFITIFVGGGLTIARIVQGGHFFSDVTFSIALMWLIALFSDRLIFTSKRSGHLFGVAEAVPGNALTPASVKENARHH